MYETLTKFTAQFDSAAFADAVNTFAKAHPDWELHNYSSIIEEKCDAFLVKDLSEVKLSALDGKTVVALLLTVSENCQENEETILNYLRRLKAIDDFVPNQDDVVLAHKHSAFHKVDLVQEQVCGCFCCGKTFSSKKIEDWYDDEGTACCPYCMIDSVIGESSGYEVTEEFLLAMEDHWFGLLRRRKNYL